MTDMIPEDVRSFVLRKFSAQECAQALEILANAALHDGTPAGPRLLRCAVIAGGNTLSGLRYQVEGLAYDYRDVILAGEYIRRKGEYVQVRHLSQPISVDA